VQTAFKKLLLLHCHIRLKSTFILHCGASCTRLQLVATCTNAATYV
jgi:hypothetical protein